MQTSPFKLFGLLFILALGVLFIISPDSYTHDLFFRIDTAWFFTCGKAWMNGMIPYIDFADSKGPLLWLIYGIGYLLSPHNYLGMFWLSVVLYHLLVRLQDRLHLPQGHETCVLCCAPDDCRFLL